MGATREQVRNLVFSSVIFSALMAGHGYLLYLPGGEYRS